MSQLETPATTANSAKIAPIVLNSEPMLLGLFAKAAWRRGLPTDGTPELPALSVRQSGLKVDPARLRRYQKVCGFQAKGPLPLTYPQIMAFGAYMRLLTDERFPLPLIGLVHLRNQITQYRPIQPEEVLDLECALTQQRSSDKGLEFDIVSRIHSSGRLVWEGTATLLHRVKRKARPARREPKSTEVPNFAHRATWELADNLGRQYAQVSGDYNLIHLYRATARLFGFKRPIIHGMWSKARCLAQIIPEVPANAVQVSVDFKLPLFLPGKVDLLWNDLSTGGDFSLRDHKTGKPHLQGSIEMIQGQG